MTLLALIVGSVTLALLQMTWVAGTQIAVLACIGIVLLVDVIPATIVAACVGLTLDLFGIRFLGLSSALVILALVASAEALRLAIRRVEEHLSITFVFLAVLLDVLALVLSGQILLQSFLATLWSLIVHALIALALLPLFRTVGERYREGLRERGVL